jgi:hypothetical protein
MHPLLRLEELGDTKGCCVCHRVQVIGCGWGNADSTWVAGVYSITAETAYYLHYCLFNNYLNPRLSRLKTKSGLPATHV